MSNNTTSAPSTPTYSWSLDREIFRFDTLRELLESHPELKPGQRVYCGDRDPCDVRCWVDADDVIENLATRSYDDCGEIAEDYPDLPEGAKEELQQLLEAWAVKYATPQFWSVTNVRDVYLIDEDFAALNAAQVQP